MKTRLVLALCATALLHCTRDAEPAATPNVYQALTWAQLEAVLPSPPGARALPRSQTAEVLGTGFCLDGSDALERVQASLLAAGWRVTHTEQLSAQRADLFAERGPFVLTGSLTQQPSDDCEQGFVYAVRSTEAAQ